MSKSAFKVASELPPGRFVRDEPVDWAGAKAAMIAHPGEYVQIAENVSSSMPTQLRAGKNKLFRGADLDNFEFYTRRPEGITYPNRRTNLWGKYTPPKSKRVTGA